MINMCGKFPAGVLLRWREVIGQHRSALPDWLITANVGDLIPRESLPIPKRDGGTRIPKGSQGDTHRYPPRKEVWPSFDEVGGHLGGVQVLGGLELISGVQVLGCLQLLGGLQVLGGVQLLVGLQVSGGDQVDLVASAPLPRSLTRLIAFQDLQLFETSDASQEWIETSDSSPE